MFTFTRLPKGCRILLEGNVSDEKQKTIKVQTFVEMVDSIQKAVYEVNYQIDPKEIGDFQRLAEFFDKDEWPYSEMPHRSALMRHAFNANCMLNLFKYVQNGLLHQPPAPVIIQGKDYDDQE